MVDIGDLKSPGRKAVWVRVPPRAQKEKPAALQVFYKYFFTLFPNNFLVPKVYMLPFYI